MDSIKTLLIQIAGRGYAGLPQLRERRCSCAGDDRIAEAEGGRQQDHKNKECTGELSAANKKNSHCGNSAAEGRGS